MEPPRSSELSKRINALLSSLRAGRSTYASCFVVRQGKPSRPCAVTIATPQGVLWHSNESHLSPHAKHLYGLDCSYWREAVRWL